MTGSNALAHALAAFGTVAPVNVSGRGHKTTPDGAPHKWTGAPVAAFRRTLYSSDSRRGLACATSDHAAIDALWSGAYACDGVAFRPGPGVVYVESDNRNGAAATLAAHGIDTGDGWHTRNDGRGALMPVSVKLWQGVGKKIALGDSVEIFVHEFVIMPMGMRASDVRVIDAHPAIVAALAAAAEAVKQHRAQAPILPAVALPTDRALSYVNACLLNAVDALRRAVAAGNRHSELTRQAFKVGRVMHLGLDERTAFDTLADAIDGWGVRDRNKDRRTIQRQLQAGAAEPFTPRANDNDTRAAFEAFGVSVWRALGDMSTAGHMPTEDGRRVRRALVVSVLAAAAEIMQRRGIFGTVAASVRCIREQRGRGSRTDIQNAISAAVRAGWLRRVGRDSVKWLARHNSIDKRLQASVYEFCALSICLKSVTDKADGRGGGVAPAQLAPDTVGQVQAQPGGYDITQAHYSPSCSLFTGTLFGQNTRLLSAGASPGEIEVLRAIAGGAGTRAGIVRAVAEAGLSRQTAYSWLRRVVVSGAVTLANGRYSVNDGIVTRSIDERLADSRILARREAVRRLNASERDAYRADIEFCQVIEATGQGATLRHRRERRANETAWIRAWLAEHGQRPTPDDVAAYRAGVMRDVLAAQLDSLPNSDATPAPMVETVTETEVLAVQVRSAPTFTAHVEQGVTAPLMLRRRETQAPRRPVLTLGAGSVSRVSRVFIASVSAPAFVGVAA